jgi:hypothetical protein
MTLQPLSAIFGSDWCSANCCVVVRGIDGGSASSETSSTRASGRYSAITHGRTWVDHRYRRFCAGTPGIPGWTFRPILDAVHQLADPGVVKESDRPGERINVRVTTELYEALQAAAKADRRSLSNFVTILFEDALAARGAAVAPASVARVKPKKAAK